MKKIALCWLLIAGAGVSALAQTRTVTNFDLDGYKQKRVAAEKALREDYARLGFPSPEERAKREAEDAKALSDLSLRLRGERIADEQSQAAREWAAAYYRAQADQRRSASNDVYFDGGSDYGWYYGNNGYRAYRVPRQRVTGSGYFAGGQYWPTGPRTAPRPLFTTPGRGQPRH